MTKLSTQNISSIDIIVPEQTVLHNFNSTVRLSLRWVKPDLITFSIALSEQEYFCSTLDGMLVHRKVPPSIKFAKHIYTPGWREAL